MEKGADMRTLSAEIFESLREFSEMYMKILSMVIATHKRYENGLLPTENSEKGLCPPLDTYDETFPNTTYGQLPNSTNSEDLKL